MPNVIELWVQMLKNKSIEDPGKNSLELYSISHEEGRNLISSIKNVMNTISWCPQIAFTSTLF